METSEGEMTPEEAAKIPIKIELGEHGLYYGTSPEVKGLLVTGNSMKQVTERMPFAIAEMRAVAAMGPELARLQAENAEAREIIAEFYGSSDEMLKLFEGISNEDAPRHGLELDYVNLDTLRRARAFLTKG